MKKVTVKKTNPQKKAKLDEAHVTELLTQWQMPFSVVAKNQQLSEKVVKEFATKLLRQKKMTKQQFDQSSH